MIETAVGAPPKPVRSTLNKIRAIKKPSMEGFFMYMKKRLFLLIEFRVARLEFVDTTGSIHELHLTSEERMGCV